jgi:hypothetical protein
MIGGGSVTAGRPRGSGSFGLSAPFALLALVDELPLGALTCTSHQRLQRAVCSRSASTVWI